MTSALGNAIAPPSRLPVATNHRVHTLWGSQLSGPWVWKSGQILWVVSDWDVWLWGRCHYPPFSDQHLLLTRKSTNSTLGPPRGPTFQTPGGPAVPCSSSPGGVGRIQEKLCGSGARVIPFSLPQTWSAPPPSQEIH